jgi:hypothetical protein
VDTELRKWPPERPFDLDLRLLQEPEQSPGIPFQIRPGPRHGLSHSHLRETVQLCLRGRSGLSKIPRQVLKDFD